MVVWLRLLESGGNYPEISGQDCTARAAKIWFLIHVLTSTRVLQAISQFKSISSFSGDNNITFGCGLFVVVVDVLLCILPSSVPVGKFSTSPIGN